MRFLPQLQQWLFRFGRNEQLPIILTQRRIFIVPTRAGLLFGLVLAVMLIGAINYNLSLGHALIFLLAGLGIVGMVHTFRNLVALRLTPGHAEAVFAGEIAHFPLHIENTRRQDRRALLFAFGKAGGVSVDVPACNRLSIAIPCPSVVRGRLDPGRITLSTRYPLGLFHAWSYPHPPLSCLVYPHPLFSPLPSPRSASHAVGHRQGSDGDEDFAGLRQRQLSDPIRHIAWKAAARDAGDRPLLVKQFAGGATEDLWLDWALTPSDQNLETRLSILAGWILAAEEQQLRYGVRLPGCERNPAQGKAQRDACLEILALYGEATR
jgi:uncharacterized protein (DUF58 family)